MYVEIFSVRHLWLALVAPYQGSRVVFVVLHALLIFLLAIITLEV